MSWLPQRWLRPRGWLLLALGLVALLLAAVWGRRDLLVVSLFLVSLPLLASLSLRLFSPNFTVQRTFWPAFVQRGELLHVTLEVTGTTSGSTARITEQLPAHMIDIPHFEYPNPRAPHGRHSSYRYSLHPNRRGIFTIGPLSAGFADPFDVALLQRKLDAGDVLTVVPEVRELPPLEMSSGRGQDGTRVSAYLNSSSDADVQTRDYRYGDSMRRVHWPATARHGKVMVRAEETLTSPEAVIIVDQRLTRFPGASRASRSPEALLTSPHFEWNVNAVVSIATHFLERGFTLQVCDDQGQPAFVHSSSSLEPERMEYVGTEGSLAVARSLATLELRSTPVTTAASSHKGSMSPEPRHADALSEGLLTTLFSTPRRGPLVAILGTVDEDDATTLAAAVPASTGAYALIQAKNSASTDRAQEILSKAGWRVVLVNHNASLPQSWLALESSNAGAVR